MGEAPATPVSPGTLRVGPSGTLTDTGIVDGTVLNDGGTVSPGLSPGALTINADYDQQGGELLLEVASATVFDQLVVGGKALLNGDLVLLFLNDFLPSSREVFTDVIAFRSIELGEHFRILTPGIVWTYEVQVSSAGLSLRSLSDASRAPEPTTLALVGLGLAGLCAVRRRRLAA